jgi:hypothetical protein
MQVKTKEPKRPLLTSVEFTDTRNGVGGFAKGWFFWVPSAFKASLDVSTNEYIDEQQTLVIRDRMSHKLFGISHDDLKKRIKDSGEKLADNEDHKILMSYAARYSRETEGRPPLYSFREGDLLESRSGDWHVQIQTAIGDAKAEEGKIGFWLFREGTPWHRNQMLETSPRDFVGLLRTGRCDVLDLTI